MAANSPIGNVTAMNIKSSDSYGEKYERKVWGKLNPSATYQQVNDVARALNGLTTHSYDDTILVTEKSVEEELA